MTAHLLDITFNDVHADAAPRDVGDLLCRGEAWCKYQHRDFVVAHVFADSQTLRGRFCQNSLTV